MKKLCVIGEALIDFIPENIGLPLREVSTFHKMAGGAPANVAASITRLSGKAKIITQLGEDPFGDYIIETLKNCGIETDDIYQTKHGDTALAFVSLTSDGNRDFKFYRKTSADLLLGPENISMHSLKDCGALHFCSVDLVESPMKQSHLKLIQLAIQQGLIVSFDPNLRIALWNHPESLKHTVQDFIPYAHILKIADDELEFITGKKNITEALPQLFIGNVRYVIITLGKDGACIYRKDGSNVQVKGHRVEVKDTTGAGDSFIGAFLYQMLADDMKNFANLQDEKLFEYLNFANAYAALTTTKKGAISALASLEELLQFMQY